MGGPKLNPSAKQVKDVGRRQTMRMLMGSCAAMPFTRVVSAAEQSTAPTSSFFLPTTWAGAVRRFSKYAQLSQTGEIKRLFYKRLLSRAGLLAQAVLPSPTPFTQRL